MIVRILVGCLLVAGLALSADALAAEHTKDKPAAVKKAVSDGKAVLVDVREQGEWNAGHLKSAKLLPLSKLKAGAKAEDVAKVVPKGTIVYLHCASGVRCLKAADALQKLGYDARALKLGYRDLLKAGFAPAK